MQRHCGRNNYFIIILFEKKKKKKKRFCVSSMKNSKNNYNIRDFRQTIMKYLSAQYETSNGEKIRGDDAMLNALFNIIAHGDQKEKMKAIKLYKELMELLAKQGLL